MIFVTVGTSHIPFDRLLMSLDVFASNHAVEILAQIGSALYEPRNYTWFRFASHHEIISHIQQASLVVAHGGFGTIAECLRLQKPIVVVPRASAFGEHSHRQEELASYLAAQGYLDYVREPEEIGSYLESGKRPPVCTLMFDSNIPQMIKEFVAQVGAKITW
jgi:UDP-N-acetylglucosamine transferase subunit ALG13